MLNCACSMISVTYCVPSEAGYLQQSRGTKESVPNHPFFPSPSLPSPSSLPSLALQLTNQPLLPRFHPISNPTPSGLVLYPIHADQESGAGFILWRSWLFSRKVLATLRIPLHTMGTEWESGISPQQNMARWILHYSTSQESLLQTLSSQDLPRSARLTCQLCTCRWAMSVRAQQKPCLIAWG